MDIVEWLNMKSEGFYNLTTKDRLEEAADEIERLRVENERLRKALERIAQYDIQAWAIDAIAPNTRVQQKESE